jgi:hypothetical protein
MRDLQSEVIPVNVMYVRLGYFCLLINHLLSQCMKIYSLNDNCKIYDVTIFIIAIVQHMK